MALSRERVEPILPPAPVVAEPFVGPRLVGIVTAAFCYFISFTMLIPTLPRYVEGDLGGSALEVGLVMGTFGVAAGLVRPLAGRFGDRRGRRILFGVGAAVTGLSVLAYPLLASIPLLVLLRAVSGIGEAGAFVGAATAIQDLAPPERRGEAASYFSVAVYTAMGVGPLAGEYLVRAGGFELVCWVAAGLSAVAVLLSSTIPAHRPGVAAEAPSRSFLHGAAVRPGLLLACSLVGFVGFTAFIALYLDELVGDANTGGIFLLYAAIVLVVRLAGARLPDRLGPRRAGSIAFTLVAAGLVILASVGSLAGVYAGTVVMALGLALSFPSLFLLVMDDTDDAERSHAIASFGFFFDVAGAAGAPLLGLVVQQTGSYRIGFAAGAVMAVVGLVELRRITDRTEPAEEPVASVAG